ncbi:zinc-finger double domain-containing protein [Ditylenchus destructor]|nr:zinc-finger double domain-containing protein [Ditylenchus destructor]
MSGWELSWSRSYISLRSDHLQSHMRIHNNKKPYKCPHCPYITPHSGYLTSHIRAHNGEKPFKCDLCPYASAYRSHLNCHKRIHTGEKPYKCDECSYAGGDRSSLRVHVVAIMLVGICLVLMTLLSHLPYFAYGNSITVTGQLICNKRFLPNVKVTLMEDDGAHGWLDTDDLITEIVSDPDGYFEVSGTDDESGGSEFYIRVKHNCEVDNEECYRESAFMAPSDLEDGALWDLSFINLNRLPANEQCQIEAEHCDPRYCDYCNKEICEGE